MLQSIVFCGSFVKSFVMLLVFAWLPIAAAHSDFDEFPDITFKVFSDFVQHQFGRDVSLATVLIVLFSLTSNTDLLGLHVRQQHPKAEREIRQPLSGWIKVLSQALWNRLGEASHSLLPNEECNSESATDTLAAKLDGLSKLLNLNPYSRQGAFRGKLKPIDEDNIAPACIICPMSMECKTPGCQSRAILRYTQDRDLSFATL